MESILTSIKKLLGIDESVTDFDTDIIIYINSAINVLKQLGVGPVTRFSITDDSKTWSDYLGQANNIGEIQTYIYMKVRLIFDPPTNSFAVEALNNQIKELEWRLNVEVETASGENSSPDVNTITYTVGPGGMQAYQVAFISANDTIMAANSSNLTHAGRIVGILTANGSEGQRVAVQTSGSITNPGWNLTAGTIYYLGSGGDLINPAPTSGFAQKIGIAQSSNELFIQIESPITLI